MADSHFRVDKVFAQPSLLLPESEVRTIVRVTALDNFTTRREELATLAGGHSANDAIAFAESLLTQAAHRRHPNS
jgi:DNA repair protein RecN (Recombination protein N)